MCGRPAAGSAKLPRDCGGGGSTADTGQELRLTGRGAVSRGRGAVSRGHGAVSRGRGAVSRGRGVASRRCGAVIRERGAVSRRRGASHITESTTPYLTKFSVSYLRRRIRMHETLTMTSGHVKLHVSHNF